MTTMTTMRAGAPPRWKCWWLAMRPRTLTASLVPVVVGLSLAPPADGERAMIATATLLSALLLQVAVNFANDCFDAEAGIDTEARLGPMRAVQSGWITPQEMRRAFVAVLGLAAAFGIPLVLRGGVPILAVGLVSMLCAYAYAGGPRPLASLGLGDLFVFLFFGIVPVAGTAWLQRLRLEAADFAVAVPVALLAVAILVVNNLRDIPTDAAAGKRTLAVRIGERATRVEYVVLVASAVASPLLLQAVAGRGALLALLATPLAFAAVRNLQARTGAALNASLAETARLQLVHGVLLAAGIFLGRL
jgi:1,4-dihydroxy-2-naphthoate octaprenyltransferase